MKLVHLSLLALAAVPLAAGDAGAAEASLTVSLQGIKTPQGAIMIALVDEATYDGKGAPLRAVAVPVKGESAEAMMQGLAPGRYAIRAFHDVDGDGKMKTNPFGMPLEPFAFSNNAQAHMGPPSWAEAAFEITAGANSHILSID